MPAARLLPALALLAAPAAAAPPIDFNRDVRPILSNNCFACHGPDEKERKADLRLDTAAGAEAVIVPGDPAASDLLARVTTADADVLMPPPKTGKKLTPNEVALLTRWIKDGGKYAPHWAYVKPVRPSLPVLRTPHSVLHTPVDHFLLARLQRDGLSFRPEADRYALARRVALDLTGLPPTVAEVDAFVNDPSPDAYEKLVDRLLAAPAFGEHWARGWLDLARYADSAGYADDPPRTVWAYRDYVIRSLNANKPFDQFTVEQLAGDLLPNPTEEQLVATAFHRNTMTNSEGGTDDEEFRTVAVVDRVNTTMTVWMGTSAACAQCHTHKYDPFTQREYFGLYAVFNNTADADKKDEAPVLNVWAGDRKKRFAEAAAVALAVRLRAAVFGPGPKEKAAAVAVAKRLKAVEPTTVPVMKELAGTKRRTTRLQHRGNFLDLGEVVPEGVPAAFPPLPAGAKPDRLALARWLVSDDNPLAARVLANRLWEQIFGTGLVRTSEEFGAQGDPPTHPELLDWLATELHRTKWDVKAFLKLLITSAAYRQSSQVTPALLEKDPDNRLLSRGPRVRHTAEMVRDQALSAAGLLSPKLYGPPARPPQPAFGLNAAFGRSMDWKPSDGEDRRRRGLYTEWRRTNPYPSMATFDAPNRDVCAVRRGRTNTPLQALVTLNDAVYVEAAQALARRMVRDGGATTAGRATHGFRLCLSRPPSDKELARLVALFAEAKADFAKHPDQATKAATDPLGPAPPGADVSELAAWTVVANVLLNLDEMVLKR